MGKPLDNIDDRDKVHWFVMSAYKKEKLAEDALSDYGLRCYIAKYYTLRTYHGKKEKVLVPYIPNIIFVHASHSQIIEFKKSNNFLQFVTWHKSSSTKYLIVKDDQMEDFIRVTSRPENEIKYYRPDEIDFSKGTYIRIHGGELDGVKGKFIRVKGKRNRQLVVIIPDVIAASIEVDPDYIEVL